MPVIQVPESRLKYVFPPGFDSQISSISSRTNHYSLSPEQLSLALVDNYNPSNHAESIVVKSAWYGKQDDAAQHEFIAIQVEDLDVKGLINYMILDRNAQAKPAKHTKLFATSQASISGGVAIDAFRVSYDGDVQHLLEECKLNPHRYLERLRFPLESPFYLYELATLAEIVSAQHPEYNAVDSNCYLFAGLIWDSLCQICPSATRERSLEKERGRYGWIRYTPNESQVKDICRVFLEKIPQVKSRLANQKIAWRDTMLAQLTQMGGLPSAVLAQMSASQY